MGIEIIGQAKERKQLIGFLNNVGYEPIAEENESNKTTTININQEIEQPTTNKDIVKDIRARTQYKYYRDFETLLNNILDSDELKTLKEIKAFCRDYKNINGSNRHLAKYNLMFISIFRELEKGYKAILEREKETLSKREVYLIKDEINEIRQQKREITNKIKKLFVVYSKQIEIKRNQHFLKNIYLHEYNKNIYFEFDFNIYNQRQKQYNKHIEVLEFKFNNSDDNNKFKEFLETTKSINYHIGKHYKRNNRVTKEGIKKQIVTATKRLIRFNRDNRNIKFNEEMIYLFLKHFEIVPINLNDIRTIRETIKNLNNIEQENIFKQRAYLYDNREFISDLPEIEATETKENDRLSFQDKRQQQNNIVLSRLTKTEFLNKCYNVLRAI